MTGPAQPEPLVATPELDDFPGAPFPEAAVAVACSLVRGAAGWHIAPSLSTVLTRDHHGGSDHVLPSLHVADVAQVVHRPSGTILEGWEFSAAGILHRPQGWPVGLRALEVTLTHGYDEAPPEIVGLVAALAGAVADTEATPGAKSETHTVGGRTDSYTWDGAAASVAVLRAYDHVIARYRIAA